VPISRCPQVRQISAPGTVSALQFWQNLLPRPGGTPQLTQMTAPGEIS
jgi:hypothetical protein